VNAAPVPVDTPLVKIVRITTETGDGINPAQVDSFQDLSVEIEVEAYTDAPFHVAFFIVRPDKDNVFGTGTQFRDPKGGLRGVGLHRLRVKFPSLPLLSGEYLWSVYTLDDTAIQMLDMAELVQPFTVLNLRNTEFGLVALNHEWVAVE
jgi:lipopolysaccharide transport system ATP-binding protein